MEKLTQDDARALFIRLLVKTPPERISPIFVETEAAKDVLKRAYEPLNLFLKEGSSKYKTPGFLVINATRGAGKTAVIQYLREQYHDRVFFAYQEKASTSPEDLFRYFVNRTGRQSITEAVQELSPDPLEVYNFLSEGGHNGTAIALAGLLENNIDAWSWLATGSSSLPRLKCGLKMVKNVRDTDALDALATVARLLTHQKPVIFAIDELENAYTELTKNQKGKLRSLLVDLINHTKFSRILFIFAATDHVYEECLLGPEADVMGLTRKIKDATVILGLPTKEEAEKIFDRIVNLYSLAYNCSFSEGEIRQIKEEFKALSTMPSNVISFARIGCDKILDMKNKDREIIEKLKNESRKIMKGLGPTEIGNKFEEAVGLLIKYIPGREFQFHNPDASPEVLWLTKLIPGLKENGKILDWSIRIDSKDFWIEVCRTKKENMAIPIGKTLAVFAKTLCHDGSAGLFVTHNFDHFGVGKGAGKLFARYPELTKRVAILNLDKEQFKLLLGLLGINEEDQKSAAQVLFRKTGLDQMLSDLRSGKHSFW
ncbi:MAG: AAA family ATPase [Theionarchaea archaeon]|nr:AAA family ATPase [Theionarchaea archaeon]